jgi:hypothetical protein
MSVWMGLHVPQICALQAGLSEGSAAGRERWVKEALHKQREAEGDGGAD